MQATGVEHPMLPGQRVCSAADGLKFQLQTVGTCLVQNKCQNGWTGGTCVNSVSPLVPDGLICCCAIDAPGSAHDSSLADFGVCKKMNDMHKKQNAKVVVDSELE